MVTNQMRRIDAGFWAQADVESLEVTGDLFGALHKFEFNGDRVEIAVPAVTLDEHLRPIGTQDHIAAFSSGFAENPTIATNSYAISYLEATIMIAEPLTVPQVLLEMSPKRPEIAGPALSARLDEMTI